MGHPLYQIHLLGQSSHLSVPVMSLENEPWLSRLVRVFEMACPWTRLFTCPIKPVSPLSCHSLWRFRDPDASSLGCLSFSAYTIFHLFQLLSRMALASLPFPWCLFLCPASWIPWLADLKPDLLLDDSKGKISLLLRKLLNEKVR